MILSNEFGHPKAFFDKPLSYKCMEKKNSSTFKLPKERVFVVLASMSVKSLNVAKKIICMKLS
jgi:hypothetical protein